jgi:hypothetical protein
MNAAKELIAELGKTREALAHLDEMRRFRHFKRYFFSMDYDWDRLNFLMKKFDQLRPELEADLDSFCSFLEKIDE